VSELLELCPQAQDRIQLRKISGNATVAFDPRHLRQVLDNLCQNALIYSRDAAEQPLAVTLRVDQPDDETCTLTVEDQGVGIDPAHQRHIFEPFFTTRQGGTGLGLYIARELCETNGAQLNYVAILPHGSGFRITFAPL
jgi:two-component system sensor histidine kinase PilS (NtrC family)